MVLSCGQGPLAADAENGVPIGAAVRQGESEEGDDSSAQLADHLATADRRSEEMGLQMQALASQMTTLMQVVSAMAGTAGTGTAEMATPGAPTVTNIPPGGPDQAAPRSAPASGENTMRIRR